MTSTVTRANAGAKPARRVRLGLAIDATNYAVERLTCHPEIGSRAFRLTKPNGVGYDVAQTEYGPTCDCPDFVFRRDGLDPDGCKHVRALVDIGLIEP